MGQWPVVSSTGDWRGGAACLSFIVYLLKFAMRHQSSIIHAATCDMRHHAAG
jgi:hypothetical protein